MKTAIFLLAAIIAASSVHSAVVAPPDGKDNPLAKPIAPGAAPADEKLPAGAADEPPPVIEPREPLPGAPGAFDPSLTNVPEERVFNSAPMVRVDLLMVSVPEEKALPLIRQLRDPAQFEAAEKTLLEMIARKEANLEGWPEVTTHSQLRAVSESIVEQRYPIEFDSPSRVDSSSTPPTGAIPTGRPVNEAATLARNISGPIPTSFETRNVGATLEVDPVVSPDGTAVTVELAPQLVRFERYAEFPAGTNARGEKLTVSQPIFTTSKVSTRLSLRDGERRLIHVGKATEDRSRIDLFILGVKIHAPLPEPR